MVEFKLSTRVKRGCGKKEQKGGVGCGSGK
jgi:hypothetical protein